MTLTSAEIAECEKIIDTLMAYTWAKLRIKMELEGKSYELAFAELQQEILSDANGT